MKIDQITLNNFRQYHGTVSVNLETNGDKNIILIGGKNGYGKTNFLIALVWCLYGEKISQVDENFKKEIQKEGNYSKFMKQSLNRDAEKGGQSNFFVELVLSEVELPESSQNSLNSISKCVIKREFDVEKMNETLSILSFDKTQEIFTLEEDKINYINDFLIPVEAGKFVFFDAEKIASLAELSTKDEGTILNEAFGKLLGLDIYKGLEEDLKVYANNLKKEGANENIRAQLTNSEKTVELNKLKIEEIDQKIAQNENEIKKKKLVINEFDTFLNSYSKINSFNDREKILEQKNKLILKEQELNNKFNELSEIIPLAMLAGKLEEVSEHLKLQEQNTTNQEAISLLEQKFDLFIERLFNKPPEPEDTSMPFKTKMFYTQKAHDLFFDMFIDNQSVSISNLSFEHDLSHADKEIIQNAIDLLKQQSKDYIEQTIENFNATQNEITELDQILKLMDANSQDEIVLEYLTKKEEEERKIEKLISENGALANQKEELLKQNNREVQRYQVLLEKINVTEQRKQKLEKVNQYIAALQEFLVEQKRQKKDNLARAIYSEMRKLMHRLQTEDDAFIAETKVDILPGDVGLKVTLYDKEGRIRQKETLSQGEKQLYISSLIKAMLAEAIQSFPIFIDTPLGRLDDEHIKNVLLYYYPDLAEQVVILATNNEITPKRYFDLKEYVAQSYLLENNNNKTILKPGYF